MKWLALLLNEGVDPLTNARIIPVSVFQEMTTARAIVSGVAADPLSIMGYGMGWFRMSYRGHDVVWHFGAIPGFSTLVAFLPKDNLGAVLLANMDEKQDTNMGILFRVIDEALGLPESGLPVSLASRGRWSRPTSVIRPNHHLLADIPPRIKTGTRTDRQYHGGHSHTVTTEHTQPSPGPSLDIDAYAGTYADPQGAYGNITLCAPTRTPPPDSYCARVLADFATIETIEDSAAQPQSNSNSRPSLFAAWPRVWSSHIRLHHIAGDSFALTLPRLFPEGFGRNTTPFEFYDSQLSVGRAEFVVDVEDGQVSGFALITDEEAAVGRQRRWGGSVKEAGDAWFGRVHP
uniref:Enterotoxin-like protein n=1 Tax=Ganoderma boninense TaxID=34458 RepID=A0A5K1K5F4_9APHY|nr:Enterotoxin-like protein [Ganoderma boninense]